MRVLLLLLLLRFWIKTTINCLVSSCFAFDQLCTMAYIFIIDSSYMYDIFLHVLILVAA